MLRHLCKSATIVWTYCVLAAVSIASANGDTVARITDLQGSATMMVNGQEHGLRILARVKDGSIIELEKGTMLTLHFSAKRRDMRFIGPGTVKVTGQSASASNGIASTKEHEDIGISLDLSGSGLGGIIARSLNVPSPKVNLQHPVKTKVIAGRPLSFGWSSGGANAVYTVSLQPTNGGAVFNARTRATEMWLPADVQLNTGMRYRWTVSTSLNNGEAMQSSSSFMVANPSETSQFLTLSSAAKDKVSDLVLYALQLEEMELQTEADTVWRRLEILRPGITATR